MAKKKKHEEHENLERWLVSYADFMTLLFATFVVLYALSQTNINEFKKIEESLKKAFSSQTFFDGGEGVMNTGDALLDTSAANSMIDFLMMEYINPRYEQESYESIKKEIDELKKNSELSGVDAKIDDRGLVITLNDSNILFKPGSAQLNDSAIDKLQIIGKLIVEKFAMHTIKVEGHTDETPIKSNIYPSNWELSSARSASIVRYLIQKFKMMPDLFVVAGYSDTRPAENGKGKSDYIKNRRVEIVVQRNQFRNLDHFQNTYMKMPKSEQQRRRNEQIQIIREIDNKEIESLGDDIKHSTGLSNEYESSLEDNNDFLNESKRIESLSYKN